MKKREPPKKDLGSPREKKRNREGNREDNRGNAHSSSCFSVGKGKGKG